MKKFIGMMAAAAVLGLAAGAQAQNGDIGGSGGTGSMGGTTGSTEMGQPQAQQVEGKVLKADKNSITIEHMGAALPLQVQSSTSFQGVKSAKDIKEGSQVRASFSLKGAKNELTSLEVLPSTGGTGSYGTESETGTEKGSDQGSKGGY